MRKDACMLQHVLLDLPFVSVSPSTPLAQPVGFLPFLVSHSVLCCKRWAAQLTIQCRCEKSDQRYSRSRPQQEPRVSQHEGGGSRQTFKSWKSTWSASLRPSQPGLHSQTMCFRFVWFVVLFRSVLKHSDGRSEPNGRTVYRRPH